MSLEQTIRQTVMSESMDLDARLQQLVRAGLMPQNTLPLLRKAIAKVQMGASLQGPERDVMATFINSMMYIVLGDDTIFNKARAGAKGYAAEEVELEESITSMSDARIKYHATKNFPHGRYTSKEIKAEHERRRKSVPNYHTVKPSLNEDEQIDELSRGTMASYIKKAVPSKRGLEDSSDRLHQKGHAAYTAGATKTSDKMLSLSGKQYNKAMKRGEGINRAADKLAKEDFELSEEVENIDELSRATVGRYSQKAKSIADNEGGKDRTKGRELAGRKKWGGTMSGVKPARVPATEEVEQVDEISKATMGRYINKAKDSIDTNSWRQGYKEAGTGSPSGRLERKLSKRHKGIETAVKKLTKESRKTEALADISAVKQMNESYRTTFNAALEQYGIKSPSELDEEKRKEFFNFVDQNYKKGDN